ncbi:MAG: Arm DNA-binding domain-containing protein, partial [Paraglaciecola chathamensis]
MDRKYPGLIIRGNSVQITFKYKNNRVRETIRTGHKPTKTMMAEIAKKRSAILYEIDMGTFDYAAHFPNSANIYKFSKRKGSMITVSKALNDWIKRAEEHCQYSTIRGYNSIITYHLVENFAQLRLDQVT